MTEQEYLQKIHELEKQVLRLQTELKKNSETQYGLRWMDVPEAFEAKAENAIPTLEEVPDKAISNDDGKPTHILIEGDNFHALTCLNYTHKGQIDVIYIDPPYNTGSDGFVYKDKRVLDKFPDGTTVPTDHPLRHSYWLSFMHKRLELAKNLLSERGVIFISIDDNEQANLKLLCDQVFGEKNFIAQIVWQKIHSIKNDARYFSQSHEYVFVYAQNIDSVKIQLLPRTEAMNSRYTNKDNDPRGPWQSGDLVATGERTNGHFIVTSPKTGKQFDVPQGKHWVYSEANLLELVASNSIWFGEDGNSFPRKKRFLSEVQGGRTPNTIWLSEEVGNNQTATREIIDLFNERGKFDFPKPLFFIQQLIQLASQPSSIILDFFGGSGTTMHATMQLNEEDGGHRQCILVQQNENNICEAVTYERNKRVMQGYTNAKGEAVAGLGNSMKYYRTAFVGEHKITDITDADKVALTQKAGCLLALGENTLEEIKTAKSYQIFQLRKGDKPTNDFGYTAVYFSGNLLQFADFRREIEQIQAVHPLTRIAVYVFTWGDPSVFENEFDDLSGITIKPIPQPILEIYQNIHQL